MNKTLITAGIVILLGYGGWVYLSLPEKGRDLSAPPPRTVNSAGQKDKESTLVYQAQVPFDQLRSRIRGVVFQNSQHSVDGAVVCKKQTSGMMVCAATKSDFTISYGSVAIGPIASNSIYLSFPVNVNGRGYYSGDNANILKSHARHFAAKGEIQAKVDLGIGPDWCVLPVATSKIKWHEGGRVETVKGEKVSTKDLINGDLAQQLFLLENTLSGAVQCEAIKREFQKVWAARSLPIKLPGNDKQRYINIKPEHLGYSNLAIDGESLKFSLVLKAGVALQNETFNFDSPNVPEPEVQPLVESEFRLTIPYQVSYDSIYNKLSGILQNRSISSRTRFGTYSLTTDEISIYPSKKAIVASVMLGMENSEKWFSDSGRAYLLMRPQLIKNNTAIKLGNIQASKGLEKGIALALEGAFIPEIRKVIIADLGKTMRSTSRLISATLTKPYTGLVLNAGDAEMKITAARPDKNHLSIEGTFTSRADVLNDVSPENPQPQGQAAQE